MAFSSINNTEIEVGDFGTQSLFQKIKDNDDYLYGQIGGLDSDQAVYNGSLEIDVDSDDVPDGWTVNLFSGGSKDLVGTASGHGQKQLEFTHPGGAGNGGGELVSPYIAVTNMRSYFVGWTMDVSSGATGIHIKVSIEIYDKDKASLGADVVLYDNQTDNPTTHRQFFAGWGPGVSAIRFIRLKFQGGLTDKNQAGTVAFDGISLLGSAPQLFSADVFTFTQRTTTSGTFASLGSPISIDLPHDWYLCGNIPLMITFPVELAITSGSGVTGEIRFDVGGTKSNVVSVTDVNDPLSAVIFLKVTPAKGESFSIQPEGRIASGTGTVGVTKGHLATSIALMNP